MYNCFDIAYKFLDLAKKENITIDTMKLLKMTYIANGYYLAFFETPLFENNIEAWKYGPVIPELYHVIKRHGHGNVKIETVELYSENKIQDTDLKFLKVIWDKFKKYGGLELSALTHIEESPWSKTYSETDQSKIIETKVIEDYYKNLVSK